MNLFPFRHAVRRPQLRTAAAFFACVLWFATGLALAGAEARGKNFTLPAGEASETLSKFAEQSGEQVVYLLNQVKGVRTNPVNGRYSPREAIDRLVAKTVLRVVEDKQTGAFMIQRGDSSPSGHGSLDKTTPSESFRRDR